MTKHVVDWVLKDNLGSKERVNAVMPQVERKIVIDSEPKAVYELAKDMEAYPSFMPDVESVKVVSREANSTVTEWVSNVDGTPFLWTEKDDFDDSKLRIDYALIEGDLEKFEGFWSFEPVEGKTCLLYTSPSPRD